VYHRTGAGASAHVLGKNDDRRGVLVMMIEMSPIKSKDDVAKSHG
jgi:hypothetical protein